MKMKIYDNINDWYHDDIDYYEMINNFRYTEDDIARIIRKEVGLKKDSLLDAFPRKHISLFRHCNAWEFFEGKEKPGHQQLFQYYNKQFNDELKNLLKLLNPKLILEVGAGDGRLTKIIKDYGFNIIGVDNYDWQFRNRIIKPVNMDYREALKKYQPDVVIGCWMPLNSDWTKDFRKTKSVNHYIQIGEIGGCTGGDWKNRKSWPISEYLPATKYCLSRTDTIHIESNSNNTTIDYKKDKLTIRQNTCVTITSRRKYQLSIEDLVGI